MINLTTLYAGSPCASDDVRYHKPADTRDVRPVVVLNLTRACNLKCIHCYTNSDAHRDPDELRTDEVKLLLEDLAAFGVRHVLFSGGEPLTRSDLFDLAAYARELKMRVTLSTNGTLISDRIADRIAQAGFAYVGISFDGVEEVHDSFRGVLGAFGRSASGLRAFAERGVRVGLRLTLTRRTVTCLDRVLDFIDRSPVQRACFYHLAYAGRGKNIQSEDLTRTQRRRTIDRLCAAAAEFAAKGRNLELLTVDNHSDGPYLYLKLLGENPVRAEAIQERLLRHGGARTSSGIGMAAIDWLGNVHPDQFSFERTLGNIRERPFSDIWSAQNSLYQQQLHDRAAHIQGRCASCRFLPMCGGGLRARAEAAGGSTELTAREWDSDPACLLTDSEIGLAGAAV